MTAATGKADRGGDTKRGERPLGGVEVVDTDSSFILPYFPYTLLSVMPPGYQQNDFIKQMQAKELVVYQFFSKAHL